jgi:hypothetical protein
MNRILTTKSSHDQHMNDDEGDIREEARRNAQAGS